MANLDNLLPGSRGAIQRKGARVAGGTGPVRMKKSPNIFQSVIGALFGILLVLGSPIAMWAAQSQHSAKDFASARPVESVSSEIGYITFSDAPTYTDSEAGTECLVANCVYQSESQQELITKQDLVCGNNVRNTDTQRILYQDGSECDENGDCVPCYQVEKDSWDEISDRETTYNVTVGSYDVLPTQSTIFLDTEEQTVETGYSDAGNETRSVYTYFTMPTTLLVAGNSDGTTVRAGEKVHVLSAFDAETTLEKLKARDRTNQIVLWILTFLMIFIGLTLILGPLSWAGRALRFVPVVGPMLSKGSQTLITAAAFLLAIPIWIVLFVLVVLLKLWWLALIFLVLVAMFIGWKAIQGKK